MWCGTRSSRKIFQMTDIFVASRFYLGPYIWLLLFTRCPNVGYDLTVVFRSRRNISLCKTNESGRLDTNLIANFWIYGSARQRKSDSISPLRRVLMCWISNYYKIKRCEYDAKHIYVLCATNTLTEYNFLFKDNGTITRHWKSSCRVTWQITSLYTNLTNKQKPTDQFIHSDKPIRLFEKAWYIT